MTKKTFNAISIVAPNGTKIITGLKTIEVRSWLPTISIGEDLVIIENEKYLNEENDLDENAKAIGVVKIKKIRAFEQNDIEKACATYWCEGYYSWELEDIRKFKFPIPAITKKGIYQVELDM